MVSHVKGPVVLMAPECAFRDPTVEAPVTEDVVADMDCAVSAVQPSVDTVVGPARSCPLVRIVPLPAFKDVAVTALVLIFPDVLTLATVRSPDNVALAADRFPATDVISPWAFKVVPASMDDDAFSVVALVAPAVNVPVVLIDPWAVSEATVVA